MGAADAASAQTRPLSLFYALSQAGRAIAAARLQGEWRLKGHGLGAANLDATSLSDVRVRPNRRQEGIDSFAGVADATESEPLKGAVDLLELWASLPGLCELIPEAERSHRMPLGVTLLGDPISNLRDWRWITTGVAPLSGSPQEIEETLAAYRQGRSAVLRTVQGLRPIQALSNHGEGVQVCWANPSEDFIGEQRALEAVAPLDPFTGERWLRPELSDGSFPSLLLSWWALLYALSMLARYQPAAWFRALDYDASPWAAALGELLRAGVEAVPQLVLSALYGTTQWETSG